MQWDIQTWGLPKIFQLREVFPDPRAYLLQAQGRHSWHRWPRARLLSQPEGLRGHPVRQHRPPEVRHQAGHTLPGWDVRSLDQM